MPIFMQSHDLMNEWACRYYNRRYYCWAEKLMPCRNWASQTKPAICYKKNNKTSQRSELCLNLVFSLSSKVQKIEIYENVTIIIQIMNKFKVIIIIFMYWYCRIQIRDHPLFSAFLQEYREYARREGVNPDVRFQKYWSYLL